MLMQHALTRADNAANNEDVFINELHSHPASISLICKQKISVGFTHFLHNQLQNKSKNCNSSYSPTFTPSLNRDKYNYIWDERFGSHLRRFKALSNNKAEKI